MNKYERVAKIAINSLNKLTSVSEKTCVLEWNKAVAQVGGSIEGCPRHAFIDLYMYWFVSKGKARKWTSPNGKYAITMFDHYKGISYSNGKHPGLFDVSANQVWKSFKTINPDWANGHTGQVDVVRAFI